MACGKGGDRLFVNITVTSGNITVTSIWGEGGRGSGGALSGAEGRVQKLHLEEVLHQPWGDPSKRGNQDAGIDSNEKV